MKTKLAICIFTVAISFFAVVGATSPFPSPFELFRFIGITHSEITEFTVFAEYSPEYSAKLTGGLVKENLSTDELDDGQWVILPAGKTDEGASIGGATITLSHAANVVIVNIKPGTDVLGRLQMLEEMIV
ncbi:MAG: hypothetical protein ACI845_002839 [Gammaproteobacteria bacterium]|jgi:hypothetical protein